MTARRSRLVQQLRWALPVWAVTVLTWWWPDNMPACRLRGWLLRPFIGRCGARLLVGRDVTLLNTDRLTVGDDVYLAKGVWLNAMGELHIEDEVVVGPYAVLATTRHGMRDGTTHGTATMVAPVRIGSGSWLAAHVVVGHGAEVGSGSVVAAGSLVTGKHAAGRMLIGVPAQDRGAARDIEGDVRRSTDIP